MNYFFLYSFIPQVFKIMFYKFLGHLVKIKPHKILILCKIKNININFSYHRKIILEKIPEYHHSWQNCSSVLLQYKYVVEIHCNTNTCIALFCKHIPIFSFQFCGHSILLTSIKKSYLILAKNNFLSKQNIFKDVCFNLQET